MHAKLSPSGAARWLRCPGSIVLSEPFPDDGSVYADEGTAAHTLASYCLEDGTNAAEYIGEVIHVGERQFKVDRNMADHVQAYVDYVRELAEGGTLLVERKVPIGHLTGEDGATGTSDAIIIKGSHVIVADLKYGMGVKVEAEGNEQAQMYALGALEAYDVLGTFETIEMVIHMPRLEHVTHATRTVAELLEFAKAVGTSAAMVRNAADDADAEHFAESYLLPGEKQCKFCKAKSICPALRAEVAGLVSDAATADDFADLVVAPVTTDTGGNFLAHAMSNVGLVEEWCKAVRAETERRLLAGKTVDGFKLVEGKRGPRKWRDATAAEALFKSFRLKQDEMYDFSLISPTTAEKVLKTSPKRWVKAKELITQSDGKLSVAPASDARPAKAPTATAEDFADLIGNTQ